MSFDHPGTTQLRLCLNLSLGKGIRFKGIKDFQSLKRVM